MMVIMLLAIFVFKTIGCTIVVQSSGEKPNQTKIKTTTIWLGIPHTNDRVCCACAYIVLYISYKYNQYHFPSHSDKQTVFLNRVC